MLINDMITSLNSQTYEEILDVLSEVNKQLIESVLKVTFLFIIVLIIFSRIIKSERVEEWLNSKWINKGYDMVKSSDVNILRQVSKEYKMEYEIIHMLLHNPATPSDVITYWITTGAWHYGLRRIHFYGPIDDNMRRNILFACVKHPNADADTLIKLTNDILNNEEDYFIERIYPEDDLGVIFLLSGNGKLPRELQDKLKEYYNWRIINGKTSTWCDENGFIKREYL